MPPGRAATLLAAASLAIPAVAFALDDGGTLILLAAAAGCECASAGCEGIES